MGKQWLLYKVSGGGGCQGTANSSSPTNTKYAGKSRKRGGQKHLSSSSSTSSGGCMSAIFHLFDIQHHHFPFHQPSFISDSSVNISQEHNVILKGVEAPRNSLELEEQEPMVEEVASSSSSSSSSSAKHKQETNFNIPMGVIQIKTKRSGLMDDASSECSTSPSTKTPNLVARLMGLDLLPENSSPRPSLSSPRPSSSSSHATPLNPISKLSSHKINTRSLPATPRVSTATRPSTEIDYHHRLSLQTNKENKQRYDENTRQYAKQIAEQVRENIKRRVGVDITNTVKNKEQRRDECLVVLKPKRPSPPPACNEFKSLNQGHAHARENEPCSPRLRLLEIKSNLNKPISNSSKSSPLSPSMDVMQADPSSSSSTIKAPPPLMKEEAVQKPMKVQKCKKKNIASEKYDLRLKKKMHQQEEAFVKKCNKKSTPLSNHLVNVNTTTKFISFKKDMESPSSSSTTTLLQKQVPLKSITHLPSCQSRSYNTNKETNKLSVQDNVCANGNGVSAVTTSGASISDHFEYISRILSHIGIQKTTQISITHWYSPSHPLHPSIFQHLEKLFHPNTSTDFANRKLIFEVVDELLAEILKPYISFKPWAGGGRNSHPMDGAELLGKLCEKIGYFPAADCRVLEDIDELIEGDMSSSTRVVGEIAFEEEAEEVVREIERDVVDTLVDELAGIIWHVGCGGRV